MFAKIRYEMMLKHVKFDAEFDSVEKKCKKFTQKKLKA